MQEAEGIWDIELGKEEGKEKKTPPEREAAGGSTERQYGSLKEPGVKDGVETIIWSSETRFMVDAWELRGEEGRDKLRKAARRSTCPVMRGWPNGVTRQERSCHRAPE